MTGGQIPPDAPVEKDGHDPIHPDDRGPPVHDDIDIPREDVADSGEHDDDDGINDPIRRRQVVSHQHFRPILPRRILLL